MTVREGPVDLHRVRAKLSNPIHVEEDVQQAAVQPGRAEERPPPAEAEHRRGARHTEQEQRIRARREKRQPAADDLNVAARDEESQRVQNRGCADDHWHEAKIRAQLSQERAVAPQTGIWPPAHVALRVPHADERSARRADDRSAGPPFEHAAHDTGGAGRRAATGDGRRGSARWRPRCLR